MAKDIAFSGAACLSIIFLVAIVSSLGGADIDNIFGGEGRNEGKEWLKVSLVITKTLLSHKIFGSLQWHPLVFRLYNLQSTNVCSTFG